MNKLEAKRTLQKVAKKNGVSLDEVRREINIAIAAGMKNPDPKVQEHWKSIPRKGEIPTPEEMMIYLTKEAKRNPANMY